VVLQCHTTGAAGRGEVSLDSPFTEAVRCDGVATARAFGRSGCKEMLRYEKSL